MRDEIFRLLRSRAATWTLAVFCVAVLVGLGAYGLSSRQVVAAAPTSMRYSELLAAMRAGRVDSIVIEPGRAIHAWMSGASGNAAKAGSRVEFGSSQVDALLEVATSANVGISFKPIATDRVGVSNFAGAIIATIALGIFVFLMLRRQSGGPAGSVEIATSDGARSTTTFADVAGNASAIADLGEVVEFLRDPKRFAGMGAKIPKGILLEGPPGTGKTLMARALAGEAKTNFFAMSGPDFSAMFLGVGTMRVKSLFRRARKAGGGVIFIDEIDSLGGKRGRQNGHVEDDRTLNQFLVEMDGFDPSAGIIVIAATNRSSDLDPALLRKGRFDRSVTVGLPTVQEREAILELHASKRRIPLGTDVELGRLARLMPGTSGADLEGLLNEAAILAVRGGSETVTWRHMEEARDRVLLGRAREGLNVSDVERRLVALHEAGHALAGLVFVSSDPLHKVTIQPRGAAMGVAFFQPDHEAHLHSRVYLEGQIRKGLGGRAAEELIYGPERITSGAASDLQHTTRVAKQMVYRLGMGRSTGLVIYDPESGPISGELHSRMDADVRAILECAYEEVMSMLRDQRRPLEALADALLARETLTGAEALEVLRAAGMMETTAA